MKWILLVSTLFLAHTSNAKEISVSGDTSVKNDTENLLHEADKRAIKDEKGQVVAYKINKVEKNSPLAKLGLKSGDILNMPKSSSMKAENTATKQKPAIE